MSFVKLNKAVELLGLHPNTLRRFADNGTIEAIKTPGGQRLYNIASYTGKSKLPVTICYCRVSSSKQRADLDSQIAYLRGLYPQAEIITDIASGLNYKRKGIQIIRCKKIRVFPTTAQKGMLAQWFGISRVAYNKSIDFLNQEGTVASFMKNKKEIYHSLPEWSSFCPSHVRQLAIKDAHEAVKSQKAKSKKSGKPFSMKFRSRKDSQIIKFSVSDYQNGLYKNKLGLLELSEQLPEKICDASLTLVNGQYYLNVPYKTILQPADNQGEMVTLDPGVRTFQTYYSPSSCGEIGAKCIGRIYRLCQYLDNLMSRKLWKPAAKVRASTFGRNIIITL